MNGLKKEDYSNFEVVEQAVNAVIRGKDIREQAVVDGYAAAIRDAVKSLEPVPALPVQIPIIEGAGQEVEKGGTNGVIIKVNGDINSFVDVAVDDTVIAEDQYTVTAGSTIITLKPEYIETLTEGTHTVTIHFSDGFAQTTLKIKEKVTEGPGPEEPDPEEPGPEGPGPEEPGPEEPGPEEPGPEEPGPEEPGPEEPGPEEPGPEEPGPEEPGPEEPGPEEPGPEEPGPEEPGDVQIPIIEGAGQEVEKGGTNGVIIKIDRDINSFVEVLVDGAVIAKDQYTVTAGSTIITLKPEYIETLTEGTHMVTIRFADGFAQTTLKVKEKVAEGPEEPDPEEPGPEEPGPEEPGPEEPGPEKPGDSLNNGQTQKPSDSSGGQGQSPAENQTPGQKDKNRAPLTGDDMPVNALFLLLLASAAGMIAGRRRRTV